MNNLHHSYRHRRVLVTGASGFIGARLTQALRQAGAKVFTLDITAGAGDERATAFHCDLRNRITMARIVAEVSPDTVFHLAALIRRDPDMDTLDDMLSVNLGGTLNLVRALQGLSQPPLLILAGTAEEYGQNSVPFTEALRENPPTPYSFSKLCVSFLARMLPTLYGVPTLVLRATVAYGPGQSGDLFLPSLVRTLADDRPFEMSEGRQIRDFIYVDDLVAAYVRAGLIEPVAVEVINVGFGKAYTLKYVAGLVGSLLGKGHLIRIGAKPYRTGEIMTYRVSIAKAKRLLSWSPRVGIREGLERMVEGYDAARG